MIDRTASNFRESQTQQSEERSGALGDGYGVSFRDMQSSKKLSWFRFSAAGSRMLRRTLGTRGRGSESDSEIGVSEMIGRSSMDAKE